MFVHVCYNFTMIICIYDNIILNDFKCMLQSDHNKLDKNFKIL